MYKKRSGEKSQLKTGFFCDIMPANIQEPAQIRPTITQQPT